MTKHTETPLHPIAERVAQAREAEIATETKIAALVAALKTVEAALFADAEAGQANVGRGQFVPADTEQHPWIPGSRAWTVVETVRAALKLAE